MIEASVPLTEKALMQTAIAQRLDEEGMAALMSWYMVNVIQPVMDGVAAIEARAKLKN